MHFAIVSSDLSSFAHTHGNLSPNEEGHHGFKFVQPVYAHGGEEEDSRKEVDSITLPQLFGPEIFLYYTFPHPGIYAIFGEFKHEGNVVVTKFMLEVGIGENAVMEAPH